MKVRALFRRSVGCFLLYLVILQCLVAETLTLVTYNVENYTAADRMTDAGYRQEYPKPEAEKKALRMVIAAMQADILVLQEMGPRPYLDELQRDLKLSGTDYPYAVLLEAGDADRHVALLSKRPLKSTVAHTDLTFAYFQKTEHVKRGLLEVTVATSAGELTIFAVHLKSRFTDRPDDPLSAQRRIGEATAVRDRVIDRISNSATARFVILGDCNDTKDSKAMQRLLRRGKTTVAELLPALDSRGDSWTHAYRKEDSFSRVDHILVSSALRSAVKDGSARIYDGPGVREASDHRPVCLTLQWGN